MMLQYARQGLVTVVLLAAFTAGANAHPHVFAEARLEVAAKADGTIDELRHVWRFDDLFSSTVLLEFDADGDNVLSTAELEDVSQTVSSSIADYGYFQSVSIGEKTIPVAISGTMAVDMVDGQLLILFATRPTEAVALSDGPHIGVFDPTFYTALEFYEESEMVLVDAPEDCKSAMVIPDPDVALEQNAANLTEAFYETSDMSDLSKILATRMEISCS